MRRVLVIGDIIADVYHRCDFKKFCPDAPGVPAAVEGEIDVRPGGAANVALNLAALAPDVLVDLVGAVPIDVGNRIKALGQGRVRMDFCFPMERGLRKDRYLLDGTMVMRVDNQLRLNAYVRDFVGARLLEYLAHHTPDLVVMSDYDGGTLYGPEDSVVLDTVLGMRDRLLVDTKLRDLSLLDGALLVKLNSQEWADVVTIDAIPERFFRYLVVTHGGEGAELVIRERVDAVSTLTHTLRVPGKHVPAVDVCGCGDTFLAGLAASLLRNGDAFTAVQFANAAAASVVSLPGTAVADLNVVMRLLGETR